MIKALLVSALVGSAFAHKKRPAPPAPPAPVVNDCNTTCLTIELTDFYGDGWDSVEFHGEKEGGDSWSMAPNCLNNHVSYEICPDMDGTYYFTAIHSNASYTPENYWEIFWTATSRNCDGSVANMFTGGYNSSLIMDYVGNEWSVQYWENLWDNEKQCDACGNAKVCKPKPKPKGKKKNKKKGNNKPSKPISGRSDDDYTGSGSDDDSMNTTMTSINTTMTYKKKKRYGPPAVDLRLTMFDEEGDGWWKNNYMGESWYLADDRREKLFHTGTLCDGSMGYCNLCLGDGSYTIRFTGVDTNFTAWDFCGVSGDRAMELTFHVLKGACYADSCVSLKTDCEGFVESHVTLTGVVAVSGFTSEFIDSSIYTAISRTVADSIDGIQADSVQVVSTSLDSRVMSGAAANTVQDITFTVSFISERSPFKVDGRSRAALDSLAYDMASTLSNSMSSGQFEAKLQLEASLNNVVSLSAQSEAELLSLEVTSVNYVGGESLISSTLPTLTKEAGSRTSTITSGTVTEGVAFFAVAVVGFVAFVGVMSKGMNTYEALPVDSVHSEVASSELDNSIAPLNQQSNVFQVDATPTSTTNL